MKRKLLALCACVIYLASCSSEAHNGLSSAQDTPEMKDKMAIESGKLVGTWIQEDTGDNIVNPLQGYQFKADGTLEPLNISTLRTSKWSVVKDELALSLKSAEDQQPDTVKYKVSVSREMLVLTSVNNNAIKETYLRIR